MNVSNVSSTQIVLATMNARYSHPAFGLRWLWANLGELRSCTSILEFTLRHTPVFVADQILAHSPVIVGLSVYIWNVDAITEVATLLRAQQPDLVLVVGGPEVGYEYEDTPLFALADYLVRGEGEVVFRELSEMILAGNRPTEKVISAPLLDLSSLALPYEQYTEEDIAHRLTYVETSRGCPFRCGFCLSSLEPRVREFPMERFLPEMERLLEQGTRRFKFVDRTFNLKRSRVKQILTFFRERWREGIQLHFEIVPDHLDPDILEMMADFPTAGLHLEIGVQSLNPASQAAIDRGQDLERSLCTLQKLRIETGALIHADLVVGLPYETWESLASGFDTLFATRPHELQVGILKRLKGTAVSKKADMWGLVFSPIPPREILSTPTLSADKIARLKRFARYFDLFHNAGNFPRSLTLLWETGTSPFAVFARFSDELWGKTQKTHEIPLVEQARYLFEFLVAQQKHTRADIAAVIECDFRRLPGRKDKLDFLFLL